MTHLCNYCKKNRVKRNDRQFCSYECYTLSDRRKEVGKINGSKWAVNFWKRFDDVFYKKWGHLDRVDQTRLLIIIGMNRVYRRKYRTKK